MYESLDDEIIRHLSPYILRIPMESFNERVYLSLRHRFVYVDGWTMASELIKNCLFRLELGDPTLAIHEQLYEDRDQAPLFRPSQTVFFDDWMQRDKPFVFTTVQNPYLRLLYIYLKCFTKGSLEDEHIRMVLGEPRIGTALAPLSFADFIQAISESHVAHMNEKWRPQYLQLVMEKMPYQDFIRFETLDADLRRVGARVSDDFSQYYTQKVPDPDLLQQWVNTHYTPELADTVRQIYAKDFECFAYSSDPSACFEVKHKPIAVGGKL